MGHYSDKIKDELLADLWQDPNYEIHQVSCPQIDIGEIDAVLYGKLLTEATSAGAVFTGAVAEIANCTFDWNYDAAAQTLHITCNKKPFYAGCEQVETRIRQLIQKAKEAI